MKTTYQVECFALLKNVDKSILYLNPLIAEDGYEFIVVSIAELEDDYSGLLRLNKNLESEGRVELPWPEPTSVGMEFFLSLKNTPLGHWDTLQAGYVVFLKRTKSYQQEVINNTVDRTGLMTFEVEMYSYVECLVRKLRLFKNGDIHSPFKFSRSLETGHVVTRHGHERTFFVSGKTLAFKKDELPHLESHLAKTFTSNKLSALAEKEFFSCYSVKDTQVKLVNLMIALESIFNIGRHPIQHIIARHLALVTTDNPSDFSARYSRIKKLYGVRSDVVHGRTAGHKENLDEIVDELQDLVRKALLFCFKFKGTSGELFAHLNKTGF